MTSPKDQAAMKLKKSVKRRQCANRAARRHRFLSLEHLEQRALLVADLQNALFNLDVNDDAYASSIDALLVINHLNSKLADPTSAAGGYLDVNGDGHVSSIDALLVINNLNARLPPLEVTL